MITVTQKALKVPVMVRHWFQPATTPGFYYLIYHTVSNRLRLELDLPYGLFQRQLAYLARHRRVISYDQALAGLQGGRPPAEDTFVLTFDDGFEDFYSHVFPLLVKYKLPATLFVTTGFVESGTPYPLLPRRAPDLRPVSWAMLANMVDSGLVTLGAHTHTHPNLVDQPAERVMAELAAPIEIMRRRLGVTVRHFAYPRALWHERLEPMVAQFYASAVIGDGQKAQSQGFQPYRIPRLPIRRSDGWLFFLAKTRGWLDDEERLYDRLRRMKTAPRR
ncbi:MAG: polysaccharide deacetylase family protein [Anaerolineae bacterium]|nr:polysaccharide deacetylase family protein [Anaerolineae bacterium]